MWASPPSSTEEYGVSAEDDGGRRQNSGDAQDVLGMVVGHGQPGALWTGLSRVGTRHPAASLTCMLAVASPSMPPKVMALVTVAR